MKTANKVKNIGFKIDKHTLVLLNRAQRETGRSITKICNDALEKWLSSFEDKRRKTA